MLQDCTVFLMSGIVLANIDCFVIGLFYAASVHTAILEKVFKQELIPGTQYYLTS